MKHLKIAGLCVTAVVAMSMVTSATASAEINWKQCREVAAGTGKWLNNKCTEAGKGNWEWKTLTASEKVTSAFTVQLRDTKVPIAGTVEVQCRGTDKGTIGPEKADSVESVLIESCESFGAKKCTKVGTVKAVNLPWTTTLAEGSEGQQRDLIRAGASGKNPGWSVECTVLGVTSTDECTSSEGSTAMEDLPNGTVKAIFEAPGGHSGTATCSVGGAKAGEVEGTDFITSEEGWAIMVS